jgi:hypothetical protein
MSQCVTSISFLSYVTYVTFVSNIIVMCHWSPNVSQETSSTDFQSCRQGGWGKKGFLGLRQTALLLAEGKKIDSVHSKRLWKRIKHCQTFKKPTPAWNRRQSQCTFSSRKDCINLSSLQTLGRRCGRVDICFAEAVGRRQKCCRIVWNNSSTIVEGHLIDWAMDGFFLVRSERTISRFQNLTD